jgi:hypothetical protein
MKQIRHSSINIEGILKLMKGKNINFFEDDEGNQMTDKEVRKEMAALQAKGYKLMPNGVCEGFDPFGGGCPGHLIKEVEELQNYCTSTGEHCKHGCSGLCKEKC